MGLPPISCCGLVRKCVRKAPLPNYLVICFTLSSAFYWHQKQSWSGPDFKNASASTWAGKGSATPAVSSRLGSNERSSMGGEDFLFQNALKATLLSVSAAPLVPARISSSESQEISESKTTTTRQNKEGSCFKCLAEHERVRRIFSSSLKKASGLMSKQLFPRHYFTWLYIKSTRCKSV